jgi:protein-S-isoprenylcysteine O-methyltransferase Ste14
MASSIYVSCWLGRSFSIFPEGRELVTHGPFSVVRHPLYLTEQIAALGTMLQFNQPWSLLLALRQ